MKQLDSIEARDIADSVFGSRHWLTENQKEEIVIRLVTSFDKVDMLHLKCPDERCSYTCFAPQFVSVKNDHRYIPEEQHSVMVSHRCPIHYIELVEVEL